MFTIAFSDELTKLAGFMTDTIQRARMNERRKHYKPPSSEDQQRSMAAAKTTLNRSTMQAGGFKAPAMPERMANPKTPYSPPKPPAVAPVARAEKPWSK